jgi:hypothetical protein
MMGGGEARIASFARANLYGIWEPSLLDIGEVRSGVINGEVEEPIGGGGDGEE